MVLDEFFRVMDAKSLEPVILSHAGVDIASLMTML